MAENKIPSTQSDSLPNFIANVADNPYISDLEQEELLKEQEREKLLSSQEIPSDFAYRCAIRIHTIYEREADEDEANVKVLQMIDNHLNHPSRYHYFADMTIIMLQKDLDVITNITTAWISCLWYGETKQKYKEFLFKFISYCIKGHRVGDRDRYVLPHTQFSCSIYAYLIGEIMINMVRLSFDFYDILVEVYKYIIITEMNEDFKAYDKQNSMQSKLKKNKEKENKIVSTYKKLYDEITDYIGQRSIFRTETLDQKNPNEYIENLIDRMRTTRRYVIQDTINQHSLKQKREFARNLQSQEATAEEILQSEESFTEGLFLFWMQKKYNFKYISLEKLRGTMHIAGILASIAFVLVSLNHWLPIPLIQSVVACIILIPSIKYVTSLRFFSRFYPIDNTETLEDTASEFLHFLMKFSYSQAASFMQKQIQKYALEDEIMLELLPDYVNFIIFLLPSKSKILMSKIELSQLLELVRGKVHQILKESKKQKKKKKR